MIKMTPSEIAFIKENIDKAEIILQSNDVDDVLDALDDWIVINGLDDNDDLTDKGRIAQRIYDSIYQNN